MIPTRTLKSKAGLNEMINYINQFYNTKELTILEVGTWAGTSAEIFAKRFKSVICVDPWEVTKGTITERENVREAENQFDKIKVKYLNITKIRDRIENIIHNFKDRSIDVIYIDGEHTYQACKRDIVLCLPKCIKFIAGHDYYGKFPGVMRVVNEEFGSPDKRFSDTSWIYKIKRS